MYDDRPRQIGVDQQRVLCVYCMEQRRAPVECAESAAVA
jgi:hypothetical protein